MRKIVFNKYTKLAELLCIIAAVSIVLFLGIRIAEVQKQVDEKGEQLKEELVNISDMNEEMLRSTIKYVDRLIMAYKYGGMDSLAHEIDNTGEMSDNVYVVAADTQYIYYQGSSPHDIQKRFWYLPEEDRVQKAYYNVKCELDEYNNVYGCSVYIGDNVEYILYKNNYGINENDNTKTVEYYSEILSVESAEYMKSLNGSLRISVYTTGYYLSRINNECWQRYDYEYNELSANSTQQKIDSYVPYFIICGIVVLLATVMLAISCGRGVEEKKVLNRYETGYTEIHLLMIAGLIAGIGLGGFAFYECYGRFPYVTGSRGLKIINMSFIGMVCLGVIWLYYQLGVILKKFINKRFFKDCLIVKLFIRIKKWMAKKYQKLKVLFKEVYTLSGYSAIPQVKRGYIRKVITDVAVLSLAVFMTVFAIIAMDRMAEESMIMVILLWMIILIYFVNSILEYMKLRKHNRVAEAIDIIYSGNYNGVVLKENERSEEMKKLANLSCSFKESVSKQVEAEKMQIELVANVSHDLKTPLTSIISYVDLLKEEEMSDVARDYVKILVDKSARLKDIVSDVFDLAKATSGETVAMEQLDGVVLINQVLSDMHDRIEGSGRELRVKLLTEVAPITGNGQKLYRVFQNVIDNALKYSMPGTRIYIGAELLSSGFVVTVKNVSEFEINYTADEIMSRFTRGDKARHSEGNGLGLSIAKSFTELCGGSFGVKLDDDVFMVIIKLH